MNGENRDSRRVTGWIVQPLACRIEESKCVTSNDIIPDIHGEAEKPHLTLPNFGWQLNQATCVYSECDL